MRFKGVAIAFCVLSATICFLAPSSAFGKPKAPNDCAVIRLTLTNGRVTTVPRGVTVRRVSQGRSEQIWTAKLPCAVQSVGKIQSVDFSSSEGSRSFGSIEANPTLKNRAVDRAIKVAGERGDVSERRDGAKKYRELYFVLPLKLAPTFDNQPVIVTCDRYQAADDYPKVARCHSSYSHPSGLYISYDVPRDAYSDDEIVKLDREQRKWLEKYFPSLPKRAKKN